MSIFCLPFISDYVGIWQKVGEVRVVGVDDSSTNRQGSSVAEHPACDGVVPGSIPGLAFSFSSYTSDVPNMSRH